MVQYLGGSFTRSHLCLQQPFVQSSIIHHPFTLPCLYYRIKRPSLLFVFVLLTYHVVVVDHHENDGYHRSLIEG